MDKEYKNTPPDVDFHVMDFEKLYNDLLSNYEELRNHKIEIVAIKEDNIQKLTNKINKLETEIECLKSHLKEMEKEYEETKKLCVEIQLSKTEKEVICEELEKKIKDISVKWQNVNINDIVEGSQVHIEKVKKCIFAYQNENGIFKEKIDILEDLIRNLESEKDLISMKLNARKESENQTWFSFSKFFFSKKENVQNDQNESGMCENKCERSKEENIAKLIITHKREKDMLIKKTKPCDDGDTIQRLKNKIDQLTTENNSLKMEIDTVTNQSNRNDDKNKEKHQQLEQDLEKSKKVCLDLQYEIEKLKNQSKEMNNEIVSIEKLKELQEQLEEKDYIIKNQKENLQSFEKEKESYRKLNLIELENDHLVLKVESLEEYIKTLEEKMSTNEKMSQKYYKTKCTSMEDYFEVDPEPLISKTSIQANEASYDENHDVINQEEEYLSCPLCSQVMLKTEIESHFAQCIENE